MSTRSAAALVLLVLCRSDGAAGQGASAGSPAARHLGVQTCSGAPCHGNQAPVGVRVRQNEYATWSTHDAHARAYDVLRGPESQLIARKLGLANAHEAPLCLGCHSDHVPRDQWGAQYALEDGVGCEACHGGAEHWLGPHISGSGDHAHFVALGLYPTDDPVARADLCLSCHYGTESKFVRHRIYGAGHPRLRFELDTFTETQPAHFTADEDYGTRGKTYSNRARTWAIGQAVIVKKTLDALSDGRRKDGIWPEFAHFDCYACHHPMSELRWAPRRASGPAARPGVARLNDASFVMLQHAVGVIDPGAAARLRVQIVRLHGALSAGTADPEAAVRELRTALASLLPTLVAWRPEVRQIRALAASLIDEGLAGGYTDYAAAEQMTMAIQALAQSLHELEAIGDAPFRAIDAESSQLLEATRDPERYQPERFTAILRRLRPRFD